VDTNNLLNTIDKHLAAFSDRQKQGVAVALVLLIAGSAFAPEIDLLGIKIQRHLVVFTGGWVFLFFHLSMLDKSLRIRHLINDLSDQDLPTAYRTIGLNSWSANPFAFFGASGLALLTSAKSIGMLLFAHILMNSWQLAYGKRSAGLVGWVLVQLVLPLLSLMLLVILWRTKREVRTRLIPLDSGLASSLTIQVRYERMWIAGFLIVGLLFYLWIAILQGQIV